MPCKNQFVIFNPWKVPWNYFSGWGADRNIFKISCHSRLVFMLHLLVNSVIIVAITRKAVEPVFILIQFFLLLEKTRVIVHPWCVRVDSPMGAFEWIIWVLESSENHNGFRGGVECNWFAWTCLIIDAKCGNGFSNLICLFILLLFIS